MQIIRLIKIYYILGKYNLIELLPPSILAYSLKTLNIIFSFKKTHRLSRGIRYRQACEELGPIFIKIGQLLSTRKDLLPMDIALELEKLQDNVPPFASSIAKQKLYDIFGEELYTHLQFFDETPLASASVAQVHAATLKDGRHIILKILRPQIHKQIYQDLKILKTAAKILAWYAKFKQFKPQEVVHELEKSLYDELDLQREAANASQLKRNFLNSKLLYIPYIYWPLTSKEVLAQERLHGIPISHIKELKKHHVDFKRLAEIGVEIFFTQVFRDCFFHADMHPGNIWVCTKDPHNPKYLGLDFGIIGTLDANNQYYLAANFLAFFNHDYRKVAELHINSGWVPSTTRVDEFEAAIRTVCEPIFAKPLNEISFGKTLLSLFQTAKRFNMEVQPQLILLQKTLLSVEGLGRQLYPQLDLWQTAKPFLQQWMKNKVGIRSIVRNLKNNAPYWVDKMPEIPHLIYKKLQETPQETIVYKNNLALGYFIAGMVTTLATIWLVKMLN